MKTKNAYLCYAVCEKKPSGTQGIYMNDRVN